MLTDSKENKTFEKSKRLISNRCRYDRSTEAAKDNPMTINNVTFVQSPFDNDNIQIIGDVVAMLGGEYSKSVCTLRVSPNITDFQEHPVDTEEVQVRNVTVFAVTPETAEYRFELGGTTQHTHTVEGKGHTFTLLRTGVKPIQGQDFPLFDFLVEVDD